jgi:hypothetical protein
MRGETLAGFLGAQERLGGRANLAIMAGDGATKRRNAFNERLP